MEYKSIVDVNGNLIDRCVMFIENKPQNFTLENYMLAVEYYDQQFLKPKWDGSKWIETATDEELNNVGGEHNTPEIEPLEDQVKTLKDQLSMLEQDMADLLLTII